MARRVVIGVERDGETALSERGAPSAEGATRDKRDAPGAGETEGDRQARDSGADDDDVDIGADAPGHSPPPEAPIRDHAPRRRRELARATSSESIVTSSRIRNAGMVDSFSGVIIFMYLQHPRPG